MQDAILAPSLAGGCEHAQPRLAQVGAQPEHGGGQVEQGWDDDVFSFEGGREDVCEADEVGHRAEHRAQHGDERVARLDVRERHGVRAEDLGERRRRGRGGGCGVTGGVDRGLRRRHACGGKRMGRGVGLSEADGEELVAVVRASW